MQRKLSTSDRLPLLITIGLFALMLVCLPLVARLDFGIDRDRPMYRDMERVRVLETAYIGSGGSPVEAKLSSGESVKIGKSKFTAADGVTITVRATAKDQFCISAQDRDGARSERCSDD